MTDPAPPAPVPSPELQAAFNRAIALHHQGDLAAAEAGYRTVLSLQPDHADAHNNLALLLKRKGQFAEAELEYRHALAIRPDQTETLNNLSVLYLETNRLDEAEALLRRALEIRNDYLEGWNNYGNLLQGLRRYKDAEAAYLKVLAQAPQRLEQLQTQSHTVAHSADARAQQRTAGARALRATLAEARWNLGLLYLLAGRYAEGWRLYEARYDPFRFSPIPSPPPLPCPQWRGEPLAGKSILVWFEQGFGDQIQFARYLPWLKAQGARRVTLVCKPALLSLLRSLEGVDEILPAEGKLVLPTPDYWAFPMSMPLHHGTTLESIPAQLPYLTAALDRIDFWSNKLPARTARRGKLIGLVWAGSEAHRNDRNRSLPSIELLAPLLSAGNACFISLQTGPRAAEAAAAAPLVVLDTPIRDFADTAAILHQLDLVITVDTAIAHVAGALNKACWVMLPWMGVDWRWLESGETSAWYPDALRLFRQPRMGDWEGVIQQVASALKPPRKTAKKAAPPSRKKMTAHTPPLKKLLHVGCGPKTLAQTTPYFAAGGWVETRLDIDPAVKPDIVGTLTDLSAVDDEGMDAVFSSHNIEHLPAHEVGLAIREMRRVLKPTGILVITCPDLRSIARLVVEDRLLEPAYSSSAGPISPLDMLFGHRSSIARGNSFMAHRCGFTLKTLMTLLRQSGFQSVAGTCLERRFELWAVATRDPRTEQAMQALLAAQLARSRQA